MPDKVKIVKCSWFNADPQSPLKCSWTGRSDKYLQHLKRFHNGREFAPEQVGL